MLNTGCHILTSNTVFCLYLGSKNVSKHCTSITRTTFCCITKTPPFNTPTHSTHLYQALEHQIAAAKRDVKAASSLVCGEELVHRTRVLRRLGYLTDDDIVTVKGRAAAELALGDELVLGDMLFSGALQGLQAEQLAALLSCFVWRERRDGSSKVW